MTKSGCSGKGEGRKEEKEEERREGERKETGNFIYIK